MHEKLNIIYGHYGCGKTNLALNLARDAALNGESVTLVDLDVVNPYFRSTDYTNQLEQLGIEVISPSLAGTALDSPSLNSGIFSAFDSHRTVFFDVGGDDAGAGALGRFSRRINAEQSRRVMYVINRFRPVTATAQGAVEILREIELASGVRATCLVNNSHLCSITTREDIISGNSYASEVFRLCSLPVFLTTVPRPLYDGLRGEVENAYPVDTVVRLPFDPQ